MKFLVLLLVLVVAGWLMIGRRSRPPQRPVPPPTPKEPVASEAMLVCAHCGVHLPRSDALMDAAGRPFCGPEHRLKGPQ